MGFSKDFLRGVATEDERRPTSSKSREVNS